MSGTASKMMFQDPSSCHVLKGAWGKTSSGAGKYFPNLPAGKRSFLQMIKSAAHIVLLLIFVVQTAHSACDEKTDYKEESSSEQKADSRSEDLRQRIEEREVELQQLYYNQNGFSKHQDTLHAVDADKIKNLEDHIAELKAAAARGSGSPRESPAARRKPRGCSAMRTVSRRGTCTDAYHNIAVDENGTPISFNEMGWIKHEIINLNNTPIVQGRKKYVKTRIMRNNMPEGDNHGYYIFHVIEESSPHLLGQYKKISDKHYLVDEAFVHINPSNGHWINQYGWSEGATEVERVMTGDDTCYWRVVV